MKSFYENNFNKMPDYRLIGKWTLHMDFGRQAMFFRTAGRN